MQPSCPRPALLQREYAEEQITPLQNTSKTETAKILRSWLQTLRLRTLVIYPDRSKSERGRARYGYVVCRDGSHVLSSEGRFGPAEGFDSEAREALEELMVALSLPNFDHVFVCLDNIATTRCLRGTPSDLSQDVFIEFQSLAREPGAVEVRWVPAYADIPGSEDADAPAKGGGNVKIKTLGHGAANCLVGSHD